MTEETRDESKGKGLHYGSEQPDIETSNPPLFHELGRERAERSGAQRGAAERASDWNSKRFERMSELTSEWPSTYVSILGCSEP